MVEDNVGSGEKLLQWMAYFISIGMSLFHIWALGLTVLDPWHLTAIHILLATVLVFLYVPIRPGSPIWRSLDVAMALLATATYLYIFYDFRGLLMRAGSFPTSADVFFGTCAILLTLESTRRMTGMAMPIVAITALLYGYFGAYLPGMFGHRGYGLERIVSYTYSLDGIFSSALQVSATYIFLFILFGAFLQASGASDFFLRLASSAVGRIRGGPAQVAVFASALFGTISGSAVANTAGTGAVTIPMMKRVGYKPHFAGAVEAVASTGGQIMPPIMGAGAFIIADIVGVTYWAVALAAIIPALLYFATVIIGIDIEAQKTGLRGVPASQLPKARLVLISDGHLLLPVFVLLFSLTVLLVSPIRAALFSLLTIFVVSFVRQHTRMTPKRLFAALAAGARGSLEVATACAAAGIVVGILNLTGLGHTIASIVIALSGGIVLIALILSMCVCIVLGMGLPTTPAYIIAAAVIAPVLIRLGIAPLQAHLFVFYFACIAVITPPVALASFTAAGIAGAPPMKVAWTGVKLGIAAFLIPYFFVFDAALIGQGTPVEVIVATTTALGGVFFLASGVHGYFLGTINTATRIAFVVGSCLLINPSIVTDVTGAGLLVLGVGGSLISRRRRVNTAGDREKVPGAVHPTTSDDAETPAAGR
jgi:TRAP transporter 4TM/12TM fusion protein